jgi:hypothetical protein
VQYILTKSLINFNRLPMSADLPVMEEESPVVAGGETPSPASEPVREHPPIRLLFSALLLVMLLAALDQTIVSTALAHHRG